MAKYEDTYSPSERFGDLEFTWDVDFPPLLANTPEASEPSEYVKVRSPLTGTGEGTNLPEGVSAEDAYRAWNLGMKEYSTMGHHIGGGLPDFHHSKFLIDPSGPPLAYYHEDTTMGERLKGHVLRNEKIKIIEAAKKAGVDPNLLWSLWKNYGCCCLNCIHERPGVYTDQNSPCYQPAKKYSCGPSDGNHS